jgi:dephospho-CoA kinase
VYPLVLQDFIRWREKQAGAPFVVLESAVILSKPFFDGLGDVVVLVTAPEEVRLRRVMARDKVGEDQVRRRMAAQFIPMERVRLVLENDGSPESLSAAVERMFFDKNAYICKFLKDK